MDNIKKLSIDFDATLGPIKPMHAVGSPPVVGANVSFFHYLKEANIPYSRLHDVGGAFSSNLYVDIPNIFRDFNADENDPASYDFAFTDYLLKNLLDNNCQPYFRLGVSIENHHYIKSFRIDPPSDNHKWARICEHIVRHYNEGWADGFHYGIEYWEIWNEPDSNHTGFGNGCWNGTSEQFFELYRVASKHLRSCFGDSIKIGGYGHCGFYAITDDKLTGAIAMGTDHALDKWEIRKIGFIEFFEQFVDMVVTEDLPFDFFSHHSYASVEQTLVMHRYAADYLAKKGLSHVEIHLNEWNCNARVAERGRSIASANTTAMMCAMQNEKMDMMCYYDARLGVSYYAGLFNPMTFQPTCVFYAMKAFGKLYAMGTQTAVTGTDSKLYAVAAKGEAGRSLLIANIGADTQVETDLPGSFTAYLVDEENYLVQTDLDPKQFLLKENQVIYLEETV